MSRFNPNNDSRNSNYGGTFLPLGSNSYANARRGPGQGTAAFHAPRRASTSMSTSSPSSISAPVPIHGSSSVSAPLSSSTIPNSVFQNYNAHHSASTPPAPSSSPSRASPGVGSPLHRSSFSNTSQTALGSIAGGFASTSHSSRPGSSAGASAWVPAARAPVVAHSWLRTGASNSSMRTASATTPTLSSAVDKMNIGGIESNASEWTFFGVDFTITNVAALAEDNHGSLNSPTGDLGSRRSASVAGTTTDSEVFSASFGGSRWKLELFRPQDPNSSDSLSLYLSCHLLETSFSPDVIPTQLMIGVREAREQASKRAARDGFVWRQWVDDFSFSHGNEFYETHNFPSLNHLLTTNARIRELDAFVLSVQIGSPVGSSLPQIRDAHPVPKALLSGVQALIDDETTGDVMIYVSERRRRNDDGSLASSFTAHESDITSTETDSAVHPSPTADESPQFRKRVLFAHAAMLKSQSTYFSAMLTDGWAETSTNPAKPGSKKRSVIKIDEFELNSIYWLLHWIYTNEITFQDVEDVRQRETEELPTGWLGSTPERLQWSWFTLAEAEKWVDQTLAATNNNEDDGSLSDIAEAETLITSKTTPLSMKAQGKQRRTASSSSTKANNARDVEPTSPTRSMSAAGRISPLFSGPPSSSSPTNPRAIVNRRSIDNAHVPHQSRNEDCIMVDPHSHPIAPQEPASALSIYRMAHRYSLPDLQSLALAQIVDGLTPRTAFPLLLSTHLWPDLHGAIKEYALAHFSEISNEPEFGRCYTEVGEGLWEHGGEVLLDFTKSLTPAAC